ncbi:MAG: nucleotide exchange factor GrpE [Firmicutes bacterium]|jgi:molecular chaperone GrpE|nr:nucleotide exchange factor GrpE [Bacillota bacterium]
MTAEEPKKWSDTLQEEPGMERSAEAGVGEGQPPAESAELEAKLKETQAQLEDFQAQFARLQADFINFRRRSERERAEVIEYANARLLKELLPVLDNLERALASAEANPEPEALRQGVAQIEKQFRAVLAKEGVEALDPGLGQPFNPEQQEALLREEGEAEVVIKELLRGYRYKERVLRPTLVQVGPSPAQEEQKTSSTDGEAEEQNG